MEKKYMERLVGKYCKIVTKEPGEDRATVVTGILEDVDYKDGFILVDSEQGLGCLRINTIVAIKPGKRRSQHKNYKNDDEAAVGIGTLIVFIAMVLVAAVAASVIMQTAETLQQRAYAVGKQTIRDVSSGMRVISVTGYADANKTVIQYLAIAITPRAGSYDLDLNKTLLYMTYDNYSILSLNTNCKSATVADGGIFSTLNHSLLNATNYGIISIHDRDNSIFNSNGIQVSDQVVIVVNLTAVLSTTGGLLPGEDINLKIVPEIGASGIFIATAPNTFGYRVVEL
ncbi:MAG: flagellin [Euryarchaeota archaeon]|nr:flagellin [Euryarchaeota archaeon]